MRDELTILQHTSCLATKRWYLRPGNAKPQVDDYGKGQTFEAILQEETDFESLACTLKTLLLEPYCYVIRGEPIPGRDLMAVRRLKNAGKDGHQPDFREVPRRWVMFDLDQALRAEDCRGVDLGTAAGCQEAIERLLKALPEPLQKARCFWQLSSSAGFKPGVRGHLWYWLDRPMGERELRRYAELENERAGRRIIDPSVFGTVQPCYTANPIVDQGLLDPVAQRWGIRAGDAVLAIPKTVERQHSYLRKLDCLRDPRCDHLHSPIRDACASYFCARGADAEDQEIKAALRKAVDRSCALRGVEVTRYTDELLAEYVDSGRKFAATSGVVAESLARNSDGSLKGTQENIRAILAGSPEWYNTLAYDLRKEQPFLLQEPPFEEDYKGPFVEYPRPWEDADDKRTVSWLQRSRHGAIVSKATVRDAIDVIARQNSVDEIADWLRSLRGRWDDEPRMDHVLVRCCGVDDSAYARKVSRYFFVQAVARALDRGCKADGVLVFDGDQGLRKSSFFREVFGGLKHFREGIGDIHNVETFKGLCAAWGVEIREMAGISNREQEAVKGFIDKQNDNFRNSYDARPQDHLRGNVFVATTNIAKMLSDPTGGRRYWPVTVGDIDTDAFLEIREQVFAEAVTAYEHGEPWWAERSDTEFLEEQEERYDVDEREQALAEFLAKGVERPGVSAFQRTTKPPKAPCTEITVRQILEWHWSLPIERQGKSQQTAVGTMLRRLGWVQRRARDSSRSRCWVKS